MNVQRSIIKIKRNRERSLQTRSSSRTSLLFSLTRRNSEARETILTIGRSHLETRREEDSTKTRSIPGEMSKMLILPSKRDLDSVLSQCSSTRKLILSSSNR
jgi:DUF1009 family protein